MEFGIEFNLLEELDKKEPDLAKIPGYFDEDILSYRIDNYGTVYRRTKENRGQTYNFKEMKWVYSDIADKEIHFGENSFKATKDEAYLKIYETFLLIKNKQN